MRRFLILLLLTLTATAGCSPGERLPEIARQTQPTAQGTVEAEVPADAPPAAKTGGSAPAPALVLIGLAVGAALMIALVSNTTMMPDTAP
jgi:hypothetical protein